MIHKGSCLCGRVKYEIHGALTDVLNCHCSDCRKAHGAAFRTRASVRTAAFKWISGEDIVSHYEAKPGEVRTFCSVCGSNLITKFNTRPDIYGIRAARLHSDPAVKRICCRCLTDKWPWHESTEALLQEAEFAPAI